MKTIVGSPIAIDMEIGNGSECVSASIHFNCDRDSVKPKTLLALFKLHERLLKNSVKAEINECYGRINLNFEI